MYRHNIPWSVSAVALTAASLFSTGATAAVVVGGATDTTPGVVPVGPGDTDLGSNRLRVGNGAAGSLGVDAGSSLSATSLYLGTSVTGNGTVLLDGIGSRIVLNGDGSNGATHRLELGSWGVGLMTVSGGAVFDTRVNDPVCLPGATACSTFIGNASGSEGTLRVTGAGSEARLRDAFIGNIAVFAPPGDGSVFGTPGGVSTGRVQVLDGARLVSDWAVLGFGTSGTAVTGSERTFAEMVVRGPQSVWQITGNAATGRAAFVIVANHVNAWSTLTIDSGGRLQFDATPGFINGINLTNNDGRSDTLVQGVGSGIDLNGGLLQVGRRLGTANMRVDSGATVNDAYYVSVGRDGSVGSLTLDGANTALTINRTGPANTSDANFLGGLQVGRNGTGTLNVSGGARIDITSTVEGQRARFLELGVGTASSGSLNISGPGSEVRIAVDSAVPGGGPMETLAPYVGVGAQGTGVLNITGGGRLLLDSTVISTDADRRSSVVNIGGGSDSTVGARGTAVVRGAGSEIAINGAERFISIGRGPSSFGELTLADGGLLSTTSVNVGRAGAVGLLTMDAGRIEMSGQFAAPNAALTSTGMGVGIGGGTGIVQLKNGSVITMVNPGTGGMGLTLGGSIDLAGGDGSLQMSGGSLITISAAPGLASLSVGRDGTALLRMSEHSRIDIGDGVLSVGRQAGSDGTVIATDGATITAGWVGIGRQRLENGSDADGGTGTMVLNDATLVAQDVVIGSNGYLGGSNGAIQVSGSVTNYGIFAPGSSPGRFMIDGQFVGGTGSRLILEVQGDATSGFETDLVQFGGSVDLGAMLIEFRFLGGTDPNQFQASGGFDIDGFLQQADGQGGYGGLDDAAFAAVSFAARADAYVFESFSFTAASGAVFTAVPVPEPGSWVMYAAGLLALSAVARRRSV